MTQQETEHWLARYAYDYHAWNTTTTPNGRKVFSRPMGLVELSFDTDGRHYGGRADLNTLLTLEINHNLSSKEDFRKRIAWAWTNLHLQHPLLMSQASDATPTGGRDFVIDVPADATEAVEKTSKSIVWVEDFYTSIDATDLYDHAFNCGRIITPSACLSKLHVLPLVPLPNGNSKLHFLIVMAHQIADGLSAYNFFSHFIRMLNTPLSTLSAEVCTHIQPTEIRKRLPPAQEDLYPKIKGSIARRRWFWAIIRVLRHVRKTLPPTFANPLRREKRLEGVMMYPSNYSRIFDYSDPERLPPMNSAHISASLSPRASARLLRLCRTANISIGAGCFALAGLSMMAVQESLFPHIPMEKRLPFTASFPLNPRAFFNFTTPAESCMLSFSDGIVMPFLPSALPVEARLKLIAKHANRELRMYQKRRRGGENAVDAHDPVRLLASGYLFQTERVDSKLPEELRKGVSPQGLLPANTGNFGATCGVSSVGSTAAYFKRGTYDLSPKPNSPEREHFAADFRGMKTGVRARDNEFLIGSTTDAEGTVNFGVSYDACGISREAAERWAEVVRGLLEAEGEEERARL